MWFAGELRKIAQQLAEATSPTPCWSRGAARFLDEGATREISNPWWIAMLDGSWPVRPDQITTAKTWESD